jgi:hypothetical protein
MRGVKRRPLWIRARRARMGRSRGAIRALRARSDFGGLEQVAIRALRARQHAHPHRRSGVLASRVNILYSARSGRITCISPTSVRRSGWATGLPSPDSSGATQDSPRNTCRCSSSIRTGQTHSDP